MMTRQDKVQAVMNHINASRPCMLTGVASWCKSQGLVSVLPEALRIMAQSGQITYEHDDDLGTILE